MFLSKRKPGTMLMISRLYKVHQLIFFEISHNHLLIEMLHWFICNIMIYSADKNGLSSTEYCRNNKYTHYCKSNTSYWMNQIANKKQRNYQYYHCQELDQSKAKCGAKTFAPFLFHQLRRTFECCNWSKIFICYNRNHEECSNIPYDANNTGNYFSNY